jgi:ATP-dependent Clp protease ATP-binding subunit ClpC
MFERFTDESRRAVVLAQEEASRLNHNYIGTEHLLAGLRREERGAAARALKSADITLDAVRGQIEALVGRGQRSPSGHIPFTPRAKKSLELSLREALKLDDDRIGSGHLLLALISQDDGVAVRVLHELGADLEQLRARAVLEIEVNQKAQGISPPLRLRLRRTQKSDAFRGLLDTIDDRLSAIERHLGLAAEEAGDPAAQPSAGNGGSADAGVGSEAGESLGSPDELARLQAEVGRLRALLREHKIDPGDPGAASAAAG